MLNATILGQVVVNGFSLSAIYILVALGFTLLFGIMRVVNFAHGELYALGAYIAYAVVSVLGLNFFGALILAAVVGFVVGALIEYVLLRRRNLAAMDEIMLIMIGVMIVMQNGELLLWG